MRLVIIIKIKPKILLCSYCGIANRRKWSVLQEVWNWLYLEEAAEQQRLAMEAASQEDEEEDNRRPEKSVSVQFRHEELHDLRAKAKIERRRESTLHTE